MELHEVMTEKFGNMPRESLRMVITSMQPCDDGLKWLDEYIGENLFADAQIEYLSWFSAPFLRSADLESADLRSANLYNADLRSANLESANLESADLESADLYNANLRSANLRSANLRSANLRSANLRSARYNKYTIFPDGFDPTTKGMILI